MNRLITSPNAVPCSCASLVFACVAVCVGVRASVTLKSSVKNLCLGLPELGHAWDILFSLPGVSNRLKVSGSGDLQMGSRRLLGLTPFPTTPPDLART